MANRYTRTLVETTAAMSLIPKPAGVLAKHTFESRWPTMTATERHDFALAYSAKPEFTSEDQQIVNMIMSDADERVWTYLLLFMIKHPQKDRVLSFIRDRLEKHPDGPGNYIQALGIARDQRAVPLLLTYYEQYRNAAQAVPAREDASFWDVEPIAKFLWCCEALWKIINSEKFADGIRAYLRHPHSQVRWWAGHALGENHK